MLTFLYTIVYKNIEITTQETIVNTERHVNMRSYQADGLYFSILHKG